MNKLKFKSIFISDAHLGSKGAQADKLLDFLNISDFVSGWLRDEKVFGRPSAPFMKSDGSLLLSDDKANVIYRITYK